MLYVIHYCIFSQDCFQLPSREHAQTCYIHLFAFLVPVGAMQSSQPVFQLGKTKVLLGVNCLTCTALHFGRSAISLVLTLNIRAEK